MVGFALFFIVYVNKNILRVTYMSLFSPALGKPTFNLLFGPKKFGNLKKACLLCFTKCFLWIANIPRWKPCGILNELWNGRRALFH